MIKNLLFYYEQHHVIFQIIEYTEENIFSSLTNKLHMKLIILNFNLIRDYERRSKENKGGESYCSVREFLASLKSYTDGISTFLKDFD